MQSVLPPDHRTVDYRVELGQVRFRRAVALMVMTLLVPGSAQLVIGRKQLGRWAIRIWVSLIGVGALSLFVGWLLPGLLLKAAASPTVLLLLRFGFTVLALGWAALFLDAWRLGQPLQLRQPQRLTMAALNIALCTTVAGSLLFASHLVGVQRNFITVMFTSGAAAKPDDGRYNILLLGADEGSDRWGLRPDSITLASINADSGETVLFGLPRNLTNFPFASGGIMAEQFPDGFNCGTGCELNALATWAADHPGLFGDLDQPGIHATKEAVEGITGLKVHYYIMVNMQGFSRLVDALGGVELNVREPIPIGGGSAPVEGYIEPGVRTLNGFETLWFARSRESADDYSRMARQKCVLNAMAQQLSPARVIRKFEAITTASQELITTDIATAAVEELAQLALKARGQPVRSLAFVPPLITSAQPDIDLIHSKVQQALAPEKPQKAQPKQASAETTGGAIGSMKKGYAANQASDLAAVC